MKKQLLLLIDDDPDEFDFFQSALEKLPGLFECSYAVNADAAFALLKKITPDYIFMDMNMPKVNGLECMSLIREKGVSKVPVFIYTTGYDEALRKRAVSLGAAACIRKPNKPGILTDMLNQLHFKGSPEIT